MPARILPKHFLFGENDDKIERTQVNDNANALLNLSLLKSPK